MVTYDDSTVKAVVEAMRDVKRADLNLAYAQNRIHHDKLHIMVTLEPDVEDAKKQLDLAMSIMAKTVH